MARIIVSVSIKIEGDGTVGFGESQHNFNVDESFIRYTGDNPKFWPSDTEDAINKARSKIMKAVEGRFGSGS
jgi:hypothetical protein